MNNSKFKELSNDEVMEVEGGCRVCRCAGYAIGWILGGIKNIFY